MRKEFYESKSWNINKNWIMIHRCSGHTAFDRWDLEGLYGSDYFLEQCFLNSFYNVCSILQKFPEILLELFNSRRTLFIFSFFHRKFFLTSPHFASSLVVYLFIRKTFPWLYYILFIIIILTTVLCFTIFSVARNFREEKKIKGKQK